MQNIGRWLSKIEFDGSLRDNGHRRPAAFLFHARANTHRSHGHAPGSTNRIDL
jgi:hypothetical protein